MKRFWFALLSPGIVVSFVLFSLTAKGENNRGLFTYLCLFLFVFNYHVMSRGDSSKRAIFKFTCWSAFAFILKTVLAREANQERYRLRSLFICIAKNWNLHFPFFIISISALRCKNAFRLRSSRLKSDSICNNIGTNYFQLFSVHGMRAKAVKAEMESEKNSFLKPRRMT